MEKIPWAFILAQTFNVVLLIFLSVYFLRERLSLYFKEKRDSFFRKMKTHQEKKNHLEKEKKRVEQLLKKTNNSFYEEVEKTKERAQKRYESLILEAQSFVENLRKKTKENRGREEKRVFEELRQHLLSLSLKKAKEHIHHSLTDQQKRFLEDELLNKIQTQH